MGGMPKARVVLKDRRWQAALPDLRARTRMAALAGLRAAAGEIHRAPRDLAAELTLTDAADLQALNRAWRDRDAPTNVLAFPSYAPGEFPPSGAIELGDVILAYEVCAAEATAAARPLGHHLAHLVVHGVLHLVGCDHQDDVEAARMEALETAILAGLGVPDPYADPSADSSPAAHAGFA